MSLIFKALQRVGQSGKASVEASEATVSPQDSGRLSRWFGSPWAVLGAAGAIFLSGILVTLAVHLVSTRDAPITSTVEAASSSPEPDTGIKPSPAPEMRSAASSAPGQSTGEFQQVTYRVHTPKAGAVKPVGTPEFTDQIQFHPAESRTGKESKGSVEEQVNAPAPSMLDASSHQYTHNTDGRRPDSHSAAGDKTTLGDRAAVSSWISQERVGPAPVDISERAAAKDITDDALNERAPEGFPDIDRMRQSIQAKRHRRVSRLAHNIQSAIQADDIALAADLIQQLARIKGSQNDFVLKLKAYSLIKQNRLDEARSLLTRVLAHSADDLEAGLNMAVIDIKSGRLDPARQRLMHLQELYPEKERIGRYLRQLPR